MTFYQNDFTDFILKNQKNNNNFDNLYLEFLDTQLNMPAEKAYTQYLW